MPRWYFRFKGRANTLVQTVELTTRTEDEREARAVANDYLQRFENSPAVRFLSVKPIEAWSTDRMEAAQRIDLEARRRALTEESAGGFPAGAAPPLVDPHDPSRAVSMPTRMK